MPRISGVTVARVAFRAGFRNTRSRDNLTIAVAIARGESGWNTTARNCCTGEDSRGLWQINVWAHPWGRKINLYDAQVNANAAYRVYRQAGYSFRPWTVYTRGIYLKHMAVAWQVVNAMGAPGSAPGEEFDQVNAPKLGEDGAFSYFKLIDKAGKRGRSAGKNATKYGEWITKHIG